MGKLIEKYKKLKQIFKKNKLKDILSMIVTSNTSTNQIALGAAIGVFLSIIPTFSLGMFTALFIAWKKKLNLLSTYLGTLIVNPYNFPFVYYINYKVGSFILGSGQPISLPITFHNIKDIAAQVYLAGILVSTVASVIVYYTLYITISRYRARKKGKRSE